MAATDVTLRVLEQIQQSIVDVRDDIGSLRIDLGARLGAVELRLDGVDTHLAEHGELLALGAERLSNLEQHAANTNLRLSNLEQHAANTNLRLSNLEDHAANTNLRLSNLERSTQELEQHAPNTNVRLSNLEDHAANTNVRLSNLEDHAANTNLRLSNLERTTERLEHHAAATHEILGIVNTRLGFFERAVTVANEARARLDDHVHSHDVRFDLVEARISTLEER